MQSFCTIITSDHYPRALALYNSVKTFNRNISFYILIANQEKITTLSCVNSDVRIHTTEDLASYPIVKSLYRKYAHINFDKFRWSLKPVYAAFLLQNSCDKLIYADCDMFFVNNYNFLFDYLDNDDILLTPNWNSTTPLINQNSFLSNFTSGMFSAGFFGVNKNALTALEWWANACHFMMGEHIEKGVNDDQRYLDMFPVLFEKTRIVLHRGCNIGSWNYEESKRVLVNGELLISEKFPIIFIHFDQMLVSTILKGHDPLLLPYLEKYNNNFELAGYKMNDFLPAYNIYKNATLLKKIKWKLRIKTRIKKWLYKIAESL